MNTFSLRPASEQDIGFIYACRNDIETRRQSINMNPVSIETIKKWQPLVFTVDRVPLGYACSERDGEFTEITCSIMLPYRNKGHGTRLVQTLIAEAGTACMALIKPRNYAAIKVAEKAGMVRQKGLKHGMEVWITEPNKA